MWCWVDGRGEHVIEKQHDGRVGGRQGDHVCVYLLVCAKAGVHVWTQMDSGRWEVVEEVGGGVAFSAFSGPAAPALPALPALCRVH